MLAVADNSAARVVRLGGVLVVATIVVLTVLTASHSGDGKPALAVFAGIFVFAFVAVTGRTADVPARVLAVGGVTGLVAAVVPTALFMVWPPAPASGRWALATMGLAAVVAGAVTAGRGTRAANPVAVMMAGVLAAVIVGLMIAPIVGAIGQFGPVSWVPAMDSHALTPASRLAERRALASDDYLPALLLGDLLALALGIVALRLRAWTRPRQTPTTGPARTIELTR